mmetsp:Transcript_51394/g.109345  ORF Transcript_51394/g.109345 Transcript_51394/m.109345 type:complete len:103 (-) Transcript_51394:297-605(-)
MTVTVCISVSIISILVVERKTFSCKNCAAMHLRFQKCPLSGEGGGVVLARAGAGINDKWCLERREARRDFLFDYAIMSSSSNITHSTKREFGHFLSFDIDPE